MNDETVRTLITSLTTICCTALTVWLAARSMAKRERLAKLEHELQKAYEEFSLLYLCEEIYVKWLGGLTGKPERQVKIEVRQHITRENAGKITLTPAAIMDRRKELGI